MNNIRNQYISGTGMWWKLRRSFIIEAVANLVLKFVLGRFLGITGILLATIFPIFIINYVQRNSILFREYFTNCRKWLFYREELVNFAVALIIAMIVYWICSLFVLGNIWMDFLAKGIICSSLCFMLYFFCIRFLPKYPEFLSFLKKLK